jgi:hypothetical protein
LGSVDRRTSAPMTTTTTTISTSIRGMARLLPSGEAAV